MTIAVGLALVVLVAAAGRAAACAGCRNPNLPMTRLSVVQLSPGEVRASATLSATSLHVVHEAGCADPSACADVPAQPLYLHDQRLFPGELRAVGEVGLTPNIGIEAHLPVRLTTTTIEYATPAGAPYQPLDPDVHHRDETIVGIGDPWLLLRAGVLMRGWLLQGRVGTSVPLGRTEANPFTLGARGERHQHVQFGTGTLDPILAGDVARRFGPVSFSAYVQGQVSPYENSRGFRAGTRLLSGVQGGTKLTDKLFGALGLDVNHDGAERWDGLIQQDGMLGRTELLAGLTATYSWRYTSVAAVVRVPIYRHIIQGDEPSGRLSSPVILSLSVSRTFGGGG